MALRIGGLATNDDLSPARYIDNVYAAGAVTFALASAKSRKQLTGGLFGVGKILLILSSVFVFVLALAGDFCVAADVIFDPGHSPAKGGATSSAGYPEYWYNDYLVRYLRDYMRANKLETDITRNPSQDFTLMQRAKMSEGKKLFFSVHHDSVQSQFLEKTNPPTSRKAKGYSIFVSRKNPYFEDSLKYAKILGQALRDGGLSPSEHHGEKIKGENREPIDKELGIYVFDDLVVLKHAKSPALLFEAAVIVNPEDEALARDKNFKDIVAKAAYETVRAVQ